MSLESTEEYFVELRILLVDCDRDILDPTDKEMLDQLKSKKDNLDHHVSVLKSHTNQQKWSSEEERKEYIEDIEESAQDLRDGLRSIDISTPVDPEIATKMQNAAQHLNDCTVGLMED